MTEPMPTDTHESLVKELAGADPVYRDVDADKLSCVLCNAENLEQGHRDDCLWVRAKRQVRSGTLSWRVAARSGLRDSDPSDPERRWRCEGALSILNRDDQSIRYLEQAELPDGRTWNKVAGVCQQPRIQPLIVNPLPTAEQGEAGI